MPVADTTPAAGETRTCCAQRPADGDPHRRARPEARRSRLHHRLRRQRDPRRRHLLLAPLQGGPRRSRARLFGRLRACSPTTMRAPSSPRRRSTRRRSPRRSASCATKSRATAKKARPRQELADTKDYLVGNFALRFDSSQKIARNLLELPARRPRHRLYRAPQRPDPGGHARRRQAGGARAMGRATLGRHRRPGRGLEREPSRKREAHAGACASRVFCPRCWAGKISGLEGVMNF